MSTEQKAKIWLMLVKFWLSVLSALLLPFLGWVTWVTTGIQDLRATDRVSAQIQSQIAINTPIIQAHEKTLAAMAQWQASVDAILRENTAQHDQIKTKLEDIRVLIASRPRTDQ